MFKPVGGLAKPIRFRVEQGAVAYRLAANCFFPGFDLSRTTLNKGEQWHSTSNLLCKSVMRLPSVLKKTLVNWGI
jgi:hypothetical protein